MRISDSEIRKLAANAAAYQQGMLLAKRKGAISISYNRSLNTYFAIVIDSDEVCEVRISFDENNQIKYVQCDCALHASKNVTCRHIIAVLIYINDNLNHKKEERIAVANQYAADIILDGTKQLHTAQSEKSRVRVQLYIEPQRYSRQKLHWVYFKIGIDKMYVLKNLEDLMDAIASHGDLTYGINFTYSSDLHTFEPPFLKTLEQLSRLREFEEAQYTRIFDGRYITLTDQEFHILLTAWMGQKVHYGRVIEAEVTDERLPDLIDLKLENNAIVCDLTRLADIVSLSGSDDVLLDQENGLLYLLDEKSAARWHPYLESLRYDARTVVFDQEQKISFLTSVIPTLETMITVPEEIRQLYIKGHLKAKFYLDRDDEKITVKPLFSYDNFSFFPYDQVTLPLSDGRLVLRDLAKEEEILKILEKTPFEFDQDVLYCDDDEAISRFVFNYMPRLQNLAEIYYTKEFEKIIRKRTIYPAHVNLSGSGNLLDVDLDLEELNYPEFKKILESYRLGEAYHRLKDGSYLELTDRKTRRILQMADDLNIEKSQLKNGHLYLPVSRAFYFHDRFGDEMQEDAAFENFISRFESQTEKADVPEHLKGILRDYQITGYQWLVSLAHYRLGGILADDMGLGKTLQTIAYLLYALKNSSGRHLIVAPTSLVMNWIEEIQRFAPAIRAVPVVGNQVTRNAILENRENVDVWVTSYPLLRHDIDQYEQMDFETCVLDEAQYIKNARSLNAKAAKRIHARTRFALTGTPIENALSELWSIFDFILPGYFSNYHHFRNKYELPIVKDEDEATAAMLKKQIEPFILRRLKDDVLKELPEKIETDLPVTMTQRQSEIYYSYLKEALARVQKQQIADKNTRFVILAALTRLRMICNHPRLFVKEYTGQSAKIIALNELLRQAIDSHRQVLVFSQFTSMLAVISEELEKQSISFFYLDGGTKPAERQTLVKRFNNGERPVFLISLKAGGTGLNLTGADMVIHVDPWWNPAVEDQATDRAYRIGQNHKVQVIKLTTRHSIEEKIAELKKRKKDLVDSMIHPGESFLDHLSEKEIVDLFTMDTEVY